MFKSWFGVDVPWFTSHNVSYIAWTWDTLAYGTTGNLITDWNGTPSGYGQAYKNALAGGSFPAPGAEYTAKVAAGGKCLDNNGSRTDATDILQWYCWSNPDQ